MKRKHLSPESTAKQATLFGNYSSEKAKVRREFKKQKNMDLTDEWDDDFMKAGFSKHGVDLVAVSARATKPRRVFNSWTEEWERKAISKKDIVHNSKLAKNIRDGRSELPPRVVYPRLSTLS